MTVVQTSQGAQQASVRTVTGTTGTYEGDWHALFDGATIAAGPFDQRLLAWINLKLSIAYTNLPQAQQALAAANGALNWSSLGTFDASTGGTPAPTNTVAPVISGTVVLGNTLSTTNGTWTDSPTSYAYQWKRDGSSIASATSSTYVLVIADIGASITCVVTASNAGGSTPATSNSLGPVVAPGATATTISASDIPAGATVYQYHIPTATITTTTRTDGQTGLSTMRDIGGSGVSKVINGGSGTNLQPVVETDAYGLRRLRFGRQEFMEMVDAVTCGSAHMAVFAVFKPTFIDQFNCLVSTGNSGAIPAVDTSAIEIYDDPTATDARQRAPRLAARYLMQGDDATWSTTALKSKILTGENLQLIWGVNRTTNDTTLNGGGNHYVRGGVNNVGVNGDTVAPTNRTGTGFTFGRRTTSLGAGGLPDRYLAGMLYELIVVSTQGATDMTFQQGQNIAAAVCTNWALPTIDRYILLLGDSRVQQTQAGTGLGGAGNSQDAHKRFGPQATYPDGDLPKNVRIVTMGVGGSTLSQLETWIGGGTPIKNMSDYMLAGGSDVNICSTFWSHNDIGDVSAYYSGAAGTAARCDSILSKYISLVGTAAANLFTLGFDKVLPWNAIASSTSSAANSLPYIRGDTGGYGAGASNGLETAAFVTACQNGDSSRVIATFDPTGLTADLVYYAKTDLTTPLGTDLAVNMFNAPTGNLSRRTQNTTGTDVYYPYIYYDQTHQGTGGSYRLGNAFGTFALAYV